MNKWQFAPYSRLLISLCAGILIEKQHSLLNGPIAFILPLFFLLALICLLIYQKNKRIIQFKAAGIFLHLSIFCSGLSIYFLQNELSSKNHFSYLNGNSAIGIISEDPVEKSKSIKCIVSIDKIQEEKWKAVNGKILLYIKSNNASRNLKYGDKIIFRLKAQDINGPANPEEFNYREYLATKQIHKQSFLDSGSWTKIDSGQANFFQELSFRWRDNMIEKLRYYIPEKSEEGVVSALIFGFKEDLDPEIVKSYAGTGTLHVLAVSGMHVGLIFTILSFAFQFLKRWKAGRIIRLMGIIICLWLFAMITGLSASVIRATVMFTFIVIGQFGSKYLNAYNSLTASAFFILTKDANMLFDTGFQLSYMAVAGILVLYKPLYMMLIPSSRIYDEIWKLISVSLAAQVGTFPLGLLYFQQFPNYFLLSNLIIIPLTTIAIYLGIVLLIFSNFNPIAIVLAYVLKQLVALTNYLAAWMESLPGALIDGIYISTSGSILIYIIIGSLIAGITFGNLKYILAAGIFSLLFSICILSDSIKNSNEFRLIVYKINNQDCLSISASNSLLAGDSSIIHDEGKIKFHIKPAFTKWGIDSCEKIVLDKNKIQKIRFKGKSILILSGPGKIKVKNPERADFLLLINGPGLNLEYDLDSLSYEKLIIGNSNKKWQLKKWKSEAEKLKKPYYCVPDSTAFIYTQRF